MWTTREDDQVRLLSCTFGFLGREVVCCEGSQADGGRLASMGAKREGWGMSVGVVITVPAVGPWLTKAVPG